MVLNSLRSSYIYEFLMKSKIYVLIIGDMWRSEIISTQTMKGRIVSTCLTTIDGFDLLNSVISRTHDIMYSLTYYRELNYVPKKEKGDLLVLGDII